MPEINHDIPNFKKKQEAFYKKLEENKAAYEKTKPEPFTMTKKEEMAKREMAKSMSMGTYVPKLLPTDASLTFKSDVDYKKSLHSFHKAKNECERNKSVVSTTKKAEAIKEMNFKEFAKKEQEKLKEEKEKAKKKER
jgi:hypothetical protein